MAKNFDDDYSDFECFSCGINTLHNDEYYMLTNEIWKEITTRKTVRQMLCIGCVEEKLSRQLTPADFAEVPLNYMPEFPRSERLQNRLTLSC